MSITTAAERPSSWSCPRPVAMLPKALQQDAQLRPRCVERLDGQVGEADAPPSVEEENVMELYQAEWCPYSSRVRQRLTELGVDFQARQVAAERDDRDALEQATGTRGIPVLVPGGDQQPISGTDEIIAWLDRTYSETPQADLHRGKAASHS